jgi:protein involved in polysaccharide export with SLBB domain
MDGNGLRFWKQQVGIGWVAQRLILPEKGMYQDLLVADLDQDGNPDLSSATHGNGIAFWPAFGKARGITVAENGKKNKHHLPLIPGTRLPEAASGQRAGSSKTPLEPKKPKIEGANPADRLPGEYVIGPGDTLGIKIWQGIKAEILKVQVSERGLISFGYIDDARASGLTVFELDKLLTIRLARFIKHPRVEIGVSKFGSKIVRVMGAVVRPRTYNVSKSITILDAILMAGGHITSTTRGDLERVKLQREGKTQTVNLLRFISGNSAGGNNPFLMDGDLVFVPEARKNAVEQPRIYVFGQAKRPGVFSHSTNMKALDAIAKAGGFTEFGLPREVRVIRGDPERPEVIRADIKALLERGDRRGNILLKPNDVIVIPRSVIGDLNEFVKQVSPLLDFLFYPARLRDVYSINTNVLKFDVGGPSGREAERSSDGTFTAGQASTSIVLQ